MGINEPADKSTDGVQLCLCKLNDISAVTVVIITKQKSYFNLVPLINTYI